MTGKGNREAAASGFPHPGAGCWLCASLDAFPGVGFDLISHVWLVPWLLRRTSMFVHQNWLKEPIISKQYLRYRRWCRGLYVFFFFFFFFKYSPPPPPCVCHVHVPSFLWMRFWGLAFLTHVLWTGLGGCWCHYITGACLQLLVEQNNSTLEVWQKIVSYIIILDFFFSWQKQKEALAGRRLLPSHRNMFSHTTAARAKPLPGPTLAVATICCPS